MNYLWYKNNWTRFYVWFCTLCRIRRCVASCPGLASQIVKKSEERLTRCCDEYIFVSRSWNKRFGRYELLAKEIDSFVICEHHRYHFSTGFSNRLHAYTFRLLLKKIKNKIELKIDTFFAESILYLNIVLQLCTESVEEMEINCSGFVILMKE